jgi:hypothetical protein
MLYYMIFAPVWQAAFSSKKQPPDTSGGCEMALEGSYGSFSPETLATVQFRMRANTE